MGYSTYFKSGFTFDEPVSEEFKNYINKFSDTRRMMRSNSKIKEIYPDWEEQCFNGELGLHGEYFVGGSDRMDASVIDYNEPPVNQPGLWCQWIITDDCKQLISDRNEKFYNFKDWLVYLIKNFILPSGYKLNGEVFWYDDYGATGTIFVDSNKVYFED